MSIINKASLWTRRFSLKSSQTLITQLTDKCIPLLTETPSKTTKTWVTTHQWTISSLISNNIWLCYHLVCRINSTLRLVRTHSKLICWWLTLVKGKTTIHFHSHSSASSCHPSTLSSSAENITKSVSSVCKCYNYWIVVENLDVP